jgi:hypothetical protein
MRNGSDKICRGNQNKRTHTQNTYCFSTATNVTRTRLNVTFLRTLPVLFQVIKELSNFMKDG